MKLKTTKITFILAISSLLAMVSTYPAIAADNSSSIRISCIIPAIPGKNVPILQETKSANTKNQVNSLVILQKDTQETKVIGEEKLLLEVKTLYSR